MFPSTVFNSRVLFPSIRPSKCFPLPFSGVRHTSCPFSVRTEACLISFSSLAFSFLFSFPLLSATNRFFFSSFHFSPGKRLPAASRVLQTNLPFSSLGCSPASHLSSFFFRVRFLSLLEHDLLVRHVRVDVFRGHRREVYRHEMHVANFRVDERAVLHPVHVVERYHS